MTPLDFRLRSEEKVETAIGVGSDQSRSLSQTANLMLFVAPKYGVHCPLRGENWTLLEALFTRVCFVLFVLCAANFEDEPSTAAY